MTLLLSVAWWAWLWRNNFIFCNPKWNIQYVCRRIRELHADCMHGVGKQSTKLVLFLVPAINLSLSLMLMGASFLLEGCGGNVAINGCW